MSELAADDEWQIINDNELYPQEDYSTPEWETDLEQSEIDRRENTNLRILEWMRDVKNGSSEGQSIQQVDVSARKHMKTEDLLFGWTMITCDEDLVVQIYMGRDELKVRSRLCHAGGRCNEADQHTCWT